MRAVWRVLSLLAPELGIPRAPGAHTVLNGGSRLAMVRIEAARGLRGLPLAPAPFRHGLIWRIARRMGLGSGTLVAVWALDAPHHHLWGAAPSLRHVRGIGVAVAAAWTGEASADGLDRLSAQLGRPAASLQDGGSDGHTAADGVEARGLGSPCLDDLAHAAAGRRTHADHQHPAVARFVSACGGV